MGVLYPGTYEFRLIQQGFGKVGGNTRSVSSGAYIVDSVRFEIVVEPWDKAMRVLSPENLNVGEPITLRIDRAALPFKDSKWPRKNNFTFLT